MNETEIQLELTKLQRKLESKVERQKFDISDSLQEIKSYVETNLQKSFNKLEDFSLILKSKRGDEIIHEKLNELFKFKQDTDDKHLIISNEISNMRSYFHTSFDKFDKLLFKNKDVNGLIGEHCKFKTYGEYLMVC